MAVGPDLTFNGGTVVGDAFVAKVKADGKGSPTAATSAAAARTAANASRWTAAGNAYVTGFTNSTEATFPVAVGPDLSFNGSPAMPSWRRSRRRGRASSTAATSAAAGVTMAAASRWTRRATPMSPAPRSTEASFPVAVGPDLSYNGEISDAFVAKVNAAGLRLLYCGYIGGSSFECGLASRLTRGQAYVTG